MLEIMIRLLIRIISFFQKCIVLREKNVLGQTKNIYDFHLSFCYIFYYKHKIDPKLPK